MHPAWPVAIVTASALLAAAAFRSTTGVLMQPIEETTGWGRGTTSGAASLNLILYGVAAPFTAALMQVWGVRRTVTISLFVVGAASAATCVMTSPWQLWVLWGVFIGLGTGSLALTFGAIIANRWFVKHRSLITGMFSAATAAGQVLFVPLIAIIANGPGWTTAALVTAGCAVITAIACLIWLRDRPSDAGVAPLGALPGTRRDEHEPTERPLHAAIRVLAQGSRRWSFWALMLTFFVCGWSTNGIVVTHLIPAASDHAMPPTVAASVIATIGMFDIIGTIASGWLTDRFDPRVLLAIYYLTRGASLLFVNALLAPHISAPLWVWIVFYGLDWTATVPPTVDLCRRVFGLADSGVAFGWVYASHMIGAGIGASVSGMLRQHDGNYQSAWLITAALCAAAGVLALTIPRSLADAHPADLSYLGVSAIKMNSGS